MIDIIQKVYEIDEGEVVIGCDGMQAIRNASNCTDITTPMMPHFDLIAAIRTLIRNSPLTFKTRHVKGHQDDVQDAVLDRWAE